MVRAYADRIVIVHDGKVVGEHRRQFGRDKTIYDAWHYIEVLERNMSMTLRHPLSAFSVFYPRSLTAASAY